MNKIFITHFFVGFIISEIPIVSVFGCFPLYIYIYIYYYSLFARIPHNHIIEI